MRYYVYSVLLYDSESWTFNKETTARIKAFEMWVYRCILKISWLDRITNTEMLKKIDKDLDLRFTTQKPKLDFLGHICFRL